MSQAKRMSIPPELTLEGLDPLVRKYCKRIPDLSEEKRQECLLQLSQVAALERTQIETTAIEKRTKAKRLLAPGRPDEPREIRIARHLYEVYSEDHYNFIIKGLMDVHKIAANLYLTVNLHQDIHVSVVPLVRALHKRFKTDETYVANKNKTRALKLRIEHDIEGHEHSKTPFQLACSALNYACSEYDSAICYCPETEFDDAVALWVCNSELKEQISETVEIMVAGSVDTALEAISEMNIEVADTLGIEAESYRFVTYTSLVRILFGKAHIMNPSVLEGDREENLEFMRKCDAYSKQNVKDLQLSDFVVEHYVQGLGIKSMFKPKHMECLKQLEFVSNPIDLVVGVHKILESLANYYAEGAGFLPFDDTLTLLMALMSLSPPSNARAIARFMDQWREIFISDLLNVTCNLFTAAIDHIMLTPIHEEEEE